MEVATRQETLLPPNALEKINLGISVSESPDMARLGFTEMHFRETLAEIARCTLNLGGKLTYGGHLDPDGYTSFLVHELERYGERLDRPLHICLAWPEHRKLSLTKLKEYKKNLGLYGHIAYLDSKGQKIAFDQERQEDPIPVTNDSEREQSLTALRRHMAETTNGRVFIGGKREGFEGSMPGLVEEAIFAMKRKQPIYLAGGFGGVTMDIVKALQIDNYEWLPAEWDDYRQENNSFRDRLASGLKCLSNTASREGRQQNGLSEDENRKLAATYRPGEIAELVCRGLGRLNNQ